MVKSKTLYKAELNSDRLLVATLYLKNMNEETVILYRPAGPEEMELVKDSGFRKWPPRLPEQPIFYPVTNQEYAEQITKEWNVKDSGTGYVKTDEDYSKTSSPVGSICVVWFICWRNSDSS